MKGVSEAQDVILHSIKTLPSGELLAFVHKRLKGVSLNGALMNCALYGFTFKHLSPWNWENAKGKHQDWFLITGSRFFDHRQIDNDSCVQPSNETHYVAFMEFIYFVMTFLFHVFFLFLMLSIHIECFVFRIYKWFLTWLQSWHWGLFCKDSVIHFLFSSSIM